MKNTDQVTKELILNHAKFFGNEALNAIVVNDNMNTLQTTEIVNDVFDAHRIHIISNPKLEYVIEIMPIFYHHNDLSDMSMVNRRSDAIHELFSEWTHAGFNKHHARSPYGSKPFQAFLDTLDYINGDYLILVRK